MVLNAIFGGFFKDFDLTSYINTHKLTSKEMRAFTAQACLTHKVEQQ